MCFFVNILHKKTIRKTYIAACTVSICKLHRKRRNQQVVVVDEDVLHGETSGGLEANGSAESVPIARSIIHNSAAR